jgi:hypothetical protein
MQPIKYIINEINQPSNATIKEFNSTVYSLIDKELEGKELIDVTIVRKGTIIVETYILKELIEPIIA